jgi:pantothenate kinase
MKDFFTNLINADGEQWFGFLVFVAFLSLICIAVMGISSNHTVRCYYPKAVITDAGIAYKIYADIDWADDIKSYTFNNANKAIETLNTLNQCASKDE